MPEDLSHYQQIASRMISEDTNRNALFEGIDAIDHFEWDMPGAMDKLDWVRKEVSSDPHDAVKAGTRVLSSLDPKVSFQSLAPDIANKKKAEGIERALKWMLMSAVRRRKVSVLRDIIRSAIMYDCVFAQVIYLPWQMKRIGNSARAQRRWKMAQRIGDFAVVVHNAKDVHVKTTSLLTEAVLLVQTTSRWDFIAMWGDRAEKALGAMDQQAEIDQTVFDNVVIYDYTDLDSRVVWATPGTQVENSDPVTGYGGAEVLREDRPDEMMFTPWVVRVGGTELDSEPEDQYRPLLYSVYKTGQWESQNITDSLLISDVIVTTAQPKIITKTQDGQGVEVDYTDPGGTLDLRIDEDAREMQRRQIDQGMLAVRQLLAERVDKSTVSRILQNADIPSNTAFAALNLATQTAVGAIKPYKELAEAALADLLTLFLYWIDYSKIGLVSYGTERADRGVQYLIKPGDFDVDHIYITVELTPDVPSDRLQRINAATIAHQSLQYPVEYALEDIGVTDPQQAMKLHRSEVLRETLTQFKIQEKLQMIQAQQQMMMQALQQGMAQMAQGQGQPALSPTPGANGSNAPEAQGIRGYEAQPQTVPQPIDQMSGPGGPGFNPAQGGIPPAMANPGQTREGQTGVDQNGNPIQPGL